MLVIANFVIMCLPYEGMPEAQEARLETAADALTCLFVVEMILKLCALGCGGYWADRWNAFDGTVTLLAASEVVFPPHWSSGGTVSYLRVARLVRLFRILDVVRHFEVSSRPVA